MIKLVPDDIEKRMLHFPDWDYYEDAIHTEFEFDNFKDCFGAMCRIASVSYTHLTLPTILRV